MKVLIDVVGHIVGLPFFFFSALCLFVVLVVGGIGWLSGILSDWLAGYEIAGRWYGWNKEKD